MTTKTVQPDSPPGAEAMTVDLEINRLVLDAASARVLVVQEAERKTYGKAHTNLSTLAEQILETWQPNLTKRQPARPKVMCPSCLEMVSTYNTGKLRVHGPADARCPEAFASPEGPKIRDTRPLRFPMNRARYNEIKERIHIHGQSVAGVITQRLAFFARQGHL